MLDKMRKYFPVPLILFGGVMADVSRHYADDIISIQIIAWTCVFLGAIGLARIVWGRIRWFWGT